MFDSPYQTTPCKDYKLDHIVSDVVNERIEGNLYTEKFPLSMVSPKSPNVPIFTQPLTRYEFGDRKDKPDVVIDARALMRLERSGEFKVTNFTEMELQENRGKLQFLWQSEHGSKQDLLRVGDLPAITFVNWISRTIAGKLGLDPEQQMKLTVVTAYYYTNLFYDVKEFDDEVKVKSVQAIVRWTRIQADKVLEVIDQLGYLANIREYIGAVHKTVDTPRVQQLELGLLYALVGSSWFGAHSRETVCVSLEHPPTFIALVYTAMNTRSYRNATIAKVALMAVKGGNDKDFIRGVQFLAKDLTI